MAETNETRRYLVTGRVQGVGFRWFVEHAAVQLGIAGWVRNRADGSVEVLASGPKDKLHQLYAELQKGPRASRVENVEMEDAAPDTNIKSFRIEGTW
ncbi:MAG TPA: acylphosphatase [Candidatus Koribacter sp.]|jgi:acylphosphatase